MSGSRATHIVGFILRQATRKGQASGSPEHAVRTSGVHLATLMNERVPGSPPFDYQILRNKFDTLVKKYKAEKQKQSQIGAAPSEWQYYLQMHRIRGPSPKEQGIPGACDGGDDEQVSIDLTGTDESLEEVLEGGVNSSMIANQSFTEFLFGDEMRDMIPPGDVNSFAAKDATLGSSSARPILCSLGDGGLESPKAIPVAAGAEKESSVKSISSLRSNPCSKPRIQGKPNKKKKIQYQ
ncbi:hypothetical protein R1sor_026883 [Riccia sorocarpa]|uniref:MADF domain-containing protein n=1 Tax=Riccia sorocarpa TaxID=122646 RepID=A0ABD3GCP7_9MARC